MKNSILQALVAVLYLTMGGIRPVEARIGQPEFTFCGSGSRKSIQFARTRPPQRTSELLLASTTGLVVELEYVELRDWTAERRYRCTIQLTSATMSRAVKVLAVRATEQREKRLRDACARHPGDAGRSDVVADFAGEYSEAANRATGRTLSLVTFLLAHLVSFRCQSELP